MSKVNHHTAAASPVSKRTVKKIRESHSKVYISPRKGSDQNPSQTSLITSMSKRNIFKITNLKPLTEETITNVTKENWREDAKHTEKLKSDDAKRDVMIDDFTQEAALTQ